jgi:hypothetical protein
LDPIALYQPSNPSSCHIISTYIVARARNALDVRAGGEKAAFACEDCEDGVGVVVEVAQGGNDGGDEFAAERVEGFRAVELLLSAS